MNKVQIFFGLETLAMLCRMSYGILFAGGYALQGSFQGELVVKEGNMSFDGSGFNINIFTG